MRLLHTIKLKDVFVMLCLYTLMLALITPFSSAMSYDSSSFWISISDDSDGSSEYGSDDGTESGAANDKDKSSAVIMLTGDLMCKSLQQLNYYNGKSFDFSDEFEYVKPLFDEADIVVGNLETNVSKSMPLSRDRSYIIGKPFLNAPAEWLDCLKDIGFDGVITANNHCCDCGAQGIRETLEALDEAGLAHTGTYSKSSDSHYFIIEENGIKVGFLGYSHYFNEHQTFLTEKQREYMLSTATEESLSKDIKALKTAGADYIIAYNHCGTEYTDKVRRDQENYAELFASLGVDYMIGSHPHVLQRYTRIMYSSKEKAMPAWYSLGNFISTLDYATSQETVIVKLVIEKDAKTGKVSLSEEGYCPVYIAKSYKGKSYVLLPATMDSYSEGTLNDDLQVHYDHITDTIGKTFDLKIYR